MVTTLSTKRHIKGLINQLCTLFSQPKLNWVHNSWSFSHVVFSTANFTFNSFFSCSDHGIIGIRYFIKFMVHEIQIISRVKQTLINHCAYTVTSNISHNRVYCTADWPAIFTIIELKSPGCWLRVLLFIIYLLF